MAAQMGCLRAWSKQAKGYSDDSDCRRMLQEWSLNYADLLATKEILALPRPHDMPEASPAPPAPRSLREVFFSWCDYTKIRDKRFEKSIRLLETVYGIAQQNVI
uniref:Uncharacterized protein n=1 Tax=Parascaris equorum TaxID=6256 RepID=A0A914RBA4_PAREQ